MMLQTRKTTSPVSLLSPEPLIRSRLAVTAASRGSPTRQCPIDGLSTRRMNASCRTHCTEDPCDCDSGLEIRSFVSCDDGGSRVPRIGRGRKAFIIQESRAFSKLGENSLCSVLPIHLNRRTRRAGARFSNAVSVRKRRPKRRHTFQATLKRFVTRVARGYCAAGFVAGVESGRAARTGNNAETGLRLSVRSARPAAPPCGRRQKTDARGHAWASWRPTPCGPSPARAALPSSVP